MITDGTVPKQLRDPHNIVLTVHLLMQESAEKYLQYFTKTIGEKLWLTVEKLLLLDSSFLL